MIESEWREKAHDCPGSFGLRCNISGRVCSEKECAVLYVIRMNVKVKVEDLWGKTENKSA